MRYAREERRPPANNLPTCTFRLLFSAYSTTQFLQSSVNKGTGYICLGSLYACFTMSLLVTPFFIASLLPRVVMPAAALVYLFVVAANIEVVTAVLLSSCALVGVAAAFLWGAQGLYLTQAAVAYARRADCSVSDASSILNGAFFGIFTSAGGASYLTASLVLLLLGPSYTSLLFSILLGIGVTGVLLLSCLVDADAPSSSHALGPPFFCRWCIVRSRRSVGEAAEATQRAEAEALAAALAALPSRGPPPSLMYMLHFLVTERDMLLLTPALLSFGATMGIYNGLWIGALAGEGIGSQWVGFIGVLYSIVVATSTLGWGRMVKARGRALPLALCAVSYALFWAVSIGWAWRYDPGQPSGDRPSFDASLAFLLCGAVALALGDGVWYVQLPAILQARYSTGPKAACVNSAIRLYTALGFAVQAGISAGVGPGQGVWQQLVGATAFFCFACATLTYAHFFELNLNNCTARQSSGSGSDGMMQGGQAVAAEQGLDAGSAVALSFSDARKDVDEPGGGEAAYDRERLPQEKGITL